MTGRTALAASLATLLAFGCSTGPKAPPLTNESDYQNNSIGLRFLTPDGWTIQSRAILPSGQLTKPIILVSYRGIGAKPAEFRVLAADLAADADPQRFLADHSIGPDAWSRHGNKESVTVNGVPADRFVLIRTAGKDQIHREVTVFRRNQRGYFFIVDFAVSDPADRDAGRAAVASVIWK